jgi:biofilm PGA synthesis N-glycosyltransferase PgaC
MLYIAYVVLFLSLINLLRIAIFLIGSDIYDIKRSHAQKREVRSSNPKRRYNPLISVLVPAHNEELVLRRNLESVFNSTYKNIELIIINDSSTDRTQSIARSFQRQHKDRFKRIKLLNIQMRGKAHALNAGLAHTKGSLFMCLDADSAVVPNAIEMAVKEFQSDPRLVCVSSNIKIFPDKGFLNIIQRIEYLTCYQMKKTEVQGGIQYIVGGIGSTFKTRVVKNLGGYDTDTITEDMDLSMKILNRYGSKYKLGYSPQVVTYTEQVFKISDLIQQRYRWRYGCYQVFFKYRKLFLSRQAKHSKLLGWFYLPYALFGQLLLILEPLSIGFIAYVVIALHDPIIIAGSFLTFVFYITMHITGATKGYTVGERLKLIASAPLAYLGLYVLTMIEYVATVRGLKNLIKIYKNYKTGQGSAAWKHVERRGNAVNN